MSTPKTFNSLAHRLYLERNRMAISIKRVIDGKELLEITPVNKIAGSEGEIENFLIKQFLDWDQEWLIITAFLPKGNSWEKIFARKYSPPYEIKIEEKPMNDKYSHGLGNMLPVPISEQTAAYFYQKLLEGEQTITKLRDQLQAAKDELTRAQMKIDLNQQMKDYELTHIENKSGGLGGLGEVVQTVLTSEQLPALLQAVLAFKTAKADKAEAAKPADMYEEIIEPDMKQTAKSICGYIISKCKSFDQNDKAFVVALAMLIEQELKQPGFIVSLRPRPGAAPNKINGL